MMWLLLLGGAGAYWLFLRDREMTECDIVAPPDIEGLLRSAYRAHVRGDHHNHLMVLQAVGTVLDGTAQPNLQIPELTRAYQLGINGRLNACQELALIGQLHGFGSDYEARQILLVAINRAIRSQEAQSYGR